MHLIWLDWLVLEMKLGTHEEWSSDSNENRKKKRTAQKQQQPTRYTLSKCNKFSCSDNASAQFANITQTPLTNSENKNLPKISTLKRIH